MLAIVQPTAYSICVASNVSVCDNKNYRVMIHPTTNKVDILCFGLEAIDASVDGVGHRIDSYTYWVYHK